MSDRYFVDRPIEGQQARLEGTEAHHLAHVMRAKPGDRVTLFDGSGAEFLASVERVGRSQIELSILSRQRIDRESRVTVELGVPLPKAERQRWLVEKAVELGVARLTPLVTERTTDRSGATAPDRLRRAVIEASKQCGRNRLMDVSAPSSLNDFLAAGPADGWRLIAQREANHCQRVLDELRASGAPPHVTLAIGPEGGFTDAELKLAAGNRWQAVALGPRVLRVETAALALATAVMLRLERD